MITAVTITCDRCLDQIRVGREDSRMPMYYDEARAHAYGEGWKTPIAQGGGRFLDGPRGYDLCPSCADGGAA